MAGWAQILGNLGKEAKKHIEEVYSTLDKGSTGKNIRHDASALASNLKTALPMLAKDPQYVTMDDMLNSGVGVMPLSVKGFGSETAKKIAHNLNNVHGNLIDASLSGNANKLTLDKLIVDKELRNQGIGSNFMKDLTQEADKNKLLMTLTAGGDFGGSKAKQNAFYKRFGFVDNKARNKDFAISDNMYRNPIEISGLPETEFSRAHAIAQQNAALPIEQGGLGLHPDNTAMERAKSLGFDVDNPVYHGTGADITEFNSGGSGKTHGAGVFLTNNQDLAATYAPGVNSGNVISALIRKESPVVIEANGANWSNLDPKVKLSAPKIKAVANSSDNELLAELTGQTVNSKPVIKKSVSGTLKKIFPREFRYGDERFSTDDLARWANEQGYGSTIFNNVKDRGPIGIFHNDSAAKPSQINAVFDPKNIRSRFAAFDPMKKNSTNILASGLLGSALLQDKKKKKKAND